MHSTPAGGPQAPIEAPRPRVREAPLLGPHARARPSLPGSRAVDRDRSAVSPRAAASHANRAADDEAEDARQGAETYAGARAAVRRGGAASASSGAVRRG